jgi:hypothetical protein
LDKIVEDGESMRMRKFKYSAAALNSWPPSGTSSGQRVLRGSRKVELVVEDVAGQS